MKGFKQKAPVRQSLGAERWRSEEVRPVVLPLPGFCYHHATKEVEPEQDRGMVGRDDLLAELVSLLENTQNSRGSYLIAGFRGAGKTALINTALSLYKGGSDHLSWLIGKRTDAKRLRDPAVAKNALNRLIKQGQASLEGKRPRGLSVARRLEAWLQRNFDPEIRIYDWHTSWKRLSHPLVHVRINLATEQILQARAVMFNTAVLLHQVLRKSQRKPVRLLRSLLLIVGLFLSLHLIIKVFLIGYRASLDLPALGALMQLIPDAADAIGGLIRSLFTVVFGPEKADTATALIRSGTSQRLLRALFEALFPALATWWMWNRYLKTPANILRRLKDLLHRGQRTVETDHSLEPGAGIHLSQRSTIPPLDAHQIEAEILDILQDCRQVWPLFGRPDVIFVFDELDKISGQRTASRVWVDAQHGGAAGVEPAADLLASSDLRYRKDRVDELLSTIKNFITEAPARFFFIAGREMLDSYQAERGSASSLYESLFNRVFEVPSLLTEPAQVRGRVAQVTENFVCRRLLPAAEATYLWYRYQSEQRGRDPLAHPRLQDLQYHPYRLRTVYHWLLVHGVEPSDARRIVFLLRHLVHFLALHSWGNCKRLNSLFEHFLKPHDNAHWVQAKMSKLREHFDRAPTPRFALQLGRMDQQRIMLASNIFLQVSLHLRGQFSSTSDKLAVSIFAAIQYLLKFHRFPFVRNQIDRTDEVLSIHRSPELNAVIDTLLVTVLRPHLRLIRNGLGRYRFIHGFQQEVRYIARVSDIESAAFNFSLDANAGVKRHYLGLLRRAVAEAGADQGAPVSAAATIAELSIALGDLYAQEESYDQATLYLITAAEVLAPLLRVENGGKPGTSLPVGLTPAILLQYVEAMLKLGDVHERAQRYERAAAAYSAAKQVVTCLLDPRTGTGGATIPGIGDVRDSVMRGDSKWDILKQPVWALQFLHLKRSPFPNQDGCVPCSRPLYRQKSSGGGVFDSEDPVYHFRAGTAAFFYGDHRAAIHHFAEAMALCQTPSTGEDSERFTWLGGYAAIGLAEAALVGLLNRRHVRIRNHLRGLHDFEKTAIILDEQIKEFVDWLFTLIKQMRHIKCAADLLYAVAEQGRLKDSLIAHLRGSMPERLSTSGREQTGADQDAVEGILELPQILGMVLCVARRFERHGLNYHASACYLKLISFWACFVECVPFSLLERVGGSDDSILTEAYDSLRDAEKWLGEVREAGFRNAMAMNGGSFHEFWYRVWQSDLVQLEESNGGSVGRGNGPMAASLDVAGHDLRPGPGERKIRVLSGVDCWQQEQGGSWIFIDSAFTEMPLWHYSFMYQEMLFATIWQKVLCRHFTMGASGHLELNHHPKLRFPETERMVPISVRNLLFSHWLRGRTLTWAVLDQIGEVVGKIEQEAGAGAGAARPRERVKGDLDTLYNEAGAAVHNLYRAHFYVRQMCGNDQDLMFPPAGVILYSLWRLIHQLVDMEARLFDKEQADRRGGGNDDAGFQGRFGGAFREVRRRLQRVSDEATPGTYFDYVVVTERLLAALSDIEQLGDLSSRARAAVLRNKYFLADDFDDPRFRLDWTLLQMLAPTSALVREFVILQQRNLKEGRGAKAI